LKEVGRNGNEEKKKRKNKRRTIMEYKRGIRIFSLLH